METALLPSSSSSSVNISTKYDVFLNFRSEDTGKNFMGHLRSSLCRKGIETYIYEDLIERGKSITPQLLKAIEDSSCSVIILSPNYASSAWCLDELVKIVDCMKTRGQVVIPIFYNIWPSDVRKQTGSFGEAFAKHEENLKEDIERVQGWRTALTEVACLVGLDLQNYRDEAQLIKDIVAEVSSKVPMPISANESEDHRFGKINPFLKTVIKESLSTVFSFARNMFLFFCLCMLLAAFCAKVLIPLLSIFFPM